MRRIVENFQVVDLVIYDRAGKVIQAVNKNDSFKQNKFVLVDVFHAVGMRNVVIATQSSFASWPIGRSLSTLRCPSKCATCLGGVRET